MKILISICARGGSKGIPGKNIILIAGKPLIAYTIDLANRLKFMFDAKVALSTDSMDIKSISDSYGLVTHYNRPEHLASDAAGKIETIRDLLIYEESLVDYKFDYILDLDITSPLRNLEDIRKSFDIFLSNADAKTLFSVSQASRNPYFNMVEKNCTGFYSLVKRNTLDTILTRQSAPKVFDLNASFYWYRRSFFESDENSVITDKSLIYEIDHMCFDLDHLLDFEFMDYLITNHKLDFDL